MESKGKKDLATLYDHLFHSLELLEGSNYAELDSNIKRAAAVRQTAHVVIDAAKLEVAVHKMKKTSALDGLFPDLGELKQLGSGDKKGRLKDE